MPVPHALTLEDCTPFIAVIWPPDDGGDRRAKAREGAHGAASGARTAKGREADRFLTVAANAAKARATPATKPPVFRRAGAQLFFAPLTEIFRIAARQRHGEKRGVVRGEKNTAGAATRTRQSGRRKTKRLETADASGRRRAAAAPEGRTGHAPARHADARESAASGQAAQTADAETASGRGSCPTSTPRPAAARPRQRTAARRRGGRRRRRPGGTRARLSAAYSLPSAQGVPFERISSAADADGSDEHGAQAGGTAAGRGEPKGAPQTPLPRAQRGARPSGRATGQATGRTADGRDGAAGGDSGRLCASVAVFSAVGDILLPIPRSSASEWRKIA